MASKPRFELPPQYSPHDVERRLYQRWLDSGVFTGHADSPKEPYVIVIPPPNVTAVLHLGHGLHNVTQHTVNRVAPVRGPEASWLPRTHRPRNATQKQGERLITKEWETRPDPGRDAFVAQVCAST